LIYVAWRCGPACVRPGPAGLHVHDLRHTGNQFAAKQRRGS